MLKDCKKSILFVKLIGNKNIFIKGEREWLI